MAKTGFKAIPKGQLSLKVPPGLILQARVKALTEGRSMAEVTTELLSRWVGDDPAIYGIKRKGGDE